MKTLKAITVGIILLFTGTMNAQDLKKTDVPQSFTKSLLEVYPEAKDIIWERSNEDYKVKFKNNLLEHKIYFNKQGDRVKVEAEIVKANLPKPLVEALKRDYSDYRIDSAKSMFQNGVTTYEVEVSKSGWTEEIELTYSEAGTVLDIDRG
ncbi:hypothetical protein BZARG_2251 [Bizionia argentinensis JUB59]|uniref:Putative beta-lactamase-inhibitor-like PepSY-like domain-containing protein n=1 Tax=Bizionia argentinensis JUB59 TaxID=1046627 RepID=G2EGE3_9FLAO|nr:PepSY-like domain-containing protein [Bizionia argentinensis]EGV42493.1 hypothetical protein BZARG_2251 [Bizionia argentinensis JUB59]